MKSQRLTREDQIKIDNLMERLALQGGGEAVMHLPKGAMDDAIAMIALYAHVKGVWVGNVGRKILGDGWAFVLLIAS